MNKIYFATSNKGKVQEISSILKLPIERADIHLDEVQSMDLEYVARKKAEEAYQKVGRPVMIDDVGVYIDAWKGMPGPFIKHFFDTLSYPGMFGLFAKEKNKNIKVVGIIAYHDGHRVHTFSGEFKGKMFPSGRGSSGFGFDPFVIPEGHEQTFAEMEEDYKNSISHRAKALAKFKKFLDSQKNKKKL